MFVMDTVEVNRGTYGGMVAVMPSEDDAFRADVSFTMGADYSMFTLYPDTIMCY